MATDMDTTTDMVEARDMDAAGVIPITASATAVAMAFRENPGSKIKLAKEPFRLEYRRRSRSVIAAGFI